MPDFYGISKRSNLLAKCIDYISNRLRLKEPVHSIPQDEEVVKKYFYLLEIVLNRVYTNPNRKRRKMMKNNYHQIGEHRERIGNTVFLVRSHINPTAKESAEQLILKLMESKIKNQEEQVA